MKYYVTRSQLIEVLKHLRRWPRWAYWSEQGYLTWVVDSV